MFVSARGPDLKCWVIRSKNEDLEETFDAVLWDHKDKSSKELTYWCFSPRLLSQ